MSNIPDYILVASLVPNRCTGCAFHTRGCSVPLQERQCSRGYNGTDDRIYIEDTDEARTVYARRRLLGADHDE